MLREEEPVPIPLQGQGLPCAVSHRRRQEVSGPITMGLCAVSVLLSTDLVQFCTVFSLPGQLRTRSQHARRLPPRPWGAPAAALAPATAVGAPELPALWQQDGSLSFWAWHWAGEEASSHWGDVRGCQVVTVGLRHLLPPQGSLEVSLSQPTRSSSGSER